MTDTSNPALASPAAEIHAVYAERIKTLRDTEARLHREHIHLGYVRLAFGLAILVLLFPPTPIALLPAVAFGIAARAHGNTLNRLAATRRVLAFYSRALARVEDRWAALEVPQPKINTAESLFAEDLDLFGPGSLFALVCETRTCLGRDLLANWLLRPADIPAVQLRQQALTELRTRLPLREAFAAAPGPPSAPLDRDALAAWGTDTATTLPRYLLWLAPVLVLLTLLAAWRFAATHSPLLLVVALVADAVVTFRYQRAYKLLFHEAERACRSLRTAAALLARIEQETFSAEGLQCSAKQLQTGTLSASRALAKLQILGVWADARSNYLVRILDAPFLYSVQLALALQRWRSRFGPELAVWLDTLAEFEALLSLAGYSFEHPADSFPTFANGAHFLAHGLGHPLLPERACVRNDVSLDAATQLLLVSGSNMSGKSTLLRSVGINTVLAFAGAPIRARSLSLSPMSLAASIHVNDSLQAGRSRFYAEILRLRAITEAAHQHPPVLFLIDELLAGTNSSDRLAGAQGLVRELLRSHAIGLLSTHDLALTSLEEEAGSPVRNVHFRDEVLDDQLHFDYTLRAGPVTRSNGLALMRLIGLSV